MFKAMNVKPLTKYELAKKIDIEMDKIHDRIVKAIGSRWFSVSVDEATTKSMTVSCMGVVVHFVNVETCDIQCAALHLQEITERQEAHYLRELCMQAVLDFDLDVLKICRVVSDGARNVRAAFL